MIEHTWEKEKLPRELASEAKKKLIYKTAVELFKEYGYDRITMKDISKKSCMSEGSIYNFFGSKAGILAGFKDRIYTSSAPLISLTNEHLSQPQVTIINYLMNQGEQFIEIGYELSNRFYTNIPFQAPPSETYHDGSLVIASQDIGLLTFIEAAQEHGSMNKNKSPKEIATNLVILCHGLISTWILHQGRTPLLELSANAFKGYLHSL